AWGAISMACRDTRRVRHATSSCRPSKTTSAAPKRANASPSRGWSPRLQISSRSGNATRRLPVTLRNSPRPCARSSPTSKSPFWNSWVGISPEHDAAHGDEDHGVGDVDPLLVVADETSPSDHPAEGALDHPATRQDLEAFLVVGSPDDLDDEVEIGGFVHQFEAVIGDGGGPELHLGPA